MGATPAGSTTMLPLVLAAGLTAPECEALPVLSEEDPDGPLHLYCPECVRAAAHWNAEAAGGVR